MRLRVSPGSCRIKPALFLGRRSYEATKPGFRFLCLLPPPRRICNRRCLSECLLATMRKNVRTDLHEIATEGWQWATEQKTKFWWRCGSLSEYSDCFPDSSWEMASIDCAARRCSARHALAGIAIATNMLTMTSLRHRPTTDGHDRRALAEVCTVPVLLVMAALCNRAGHYICTHGVALVRI